MSYTNLGSSNSELPRLPILPNDLKPTLTFSSPNLSVLRNPRLPAVASNTTEAISRKSSLKRITDSLEAKINALLPPETKAKSVKFQSEPENARKNRLAPTIAHRIRVNDRLQEAAEIQKLEANLVESAYTTRFENLIAEFKHTWRILSRGMQAKETLIRSRNRSDGGEHVYC